MRHIIILHRKLRKLFRFVIFGFIFFFNFFIFRVHLKAWFLVRNKSCAACTHDSDRSGKFAAQHHDEPNVWCSVVNIAYRLGANHQNVTFLDTIYCNGHGHPFKQSHSAFSFSFDFKAFSSVRWTHLFRPKIVI